MFQIQRKYQGKFQSEQNKKFQISKTQNMIESPNSSIEFPADFCRLNIVSNFEMVLKDIKSRRRFKFPTNHFDYVRNTDSEIIFVCSSCYFYASVINLMMWILSKYIFILDVSSEILTSNVQQNLPSSCEKLHNAKSTFYIRNNDRKKTEPNLWKWFHCISF